MTPACRSACRWRDGRVIGASPPGRKTLPVPGVIECRRGKGGRSVPGAAWTGGPMTSGAPPPAAALELQIAVLGELSVRHDGRLLALSPSEQKLIAYLALADRPVRRSHVASTLWRGPRGRE